MENQEHLNPEYSSRGFKRMPPFRCTYNSLVEVRESSCADSPHIWLDIEVDPDVLNNGSGRAVAHLNFEKTQILIEQLQWLMQNHYQIEWEQEKHEVQ